jgi:purine-cytosine permease-like protein
MNYLLICLMLLPSLFAIALFDYLVFKRWYKCDKCGYERSLWYHWLLPTFIEATLFILGVVIGFLIGGGR